ncbi:ankyrin repeat-containing domain protein, partial [Flagelloscypha sp. PMI_526]
MPSKYLIFAAQCLARIFQRTGLSIASICAVKYAGQNDLPWPNQPHSLREDELSAISGSVMTSNCLRWLRDLSSNVTVRRVVAWTAAAHDYDSTMSPNLTSVCDLPTAQLICQAAIEADDTSHVVYNPRIDWVGQPAAELIFPSASNGRDNTNLLPIRALRRLSENSRCLDPLAWAELVENCVKSAVQNNHPAALHALLSCVSEHDLSRKRRSMALIEASQRGHLGVARLLLEMGADVNFSERGVGSALATAAWGGQLEVARLLVEYGADVNLNDQWFGSALTAAVQGGTIEVTKLLVDKGADVNLLLSRGVYGSALAAAAWRGNLKVVKFLVEKGADANLQLVTGEYGSALAAAAQRGTFEIVEFLVKRGADVNMSLNHGLYGSALAAATRRGALKVVEFLVETGADV